MGGTNRGYPIAQIVHGDLVACETHCSKHQPNVTRMRHDPCLVGLDVLIDSRFVSSSRAVASTPGAWVSSGTQAVFEVAIISMAAYSQARSAFALGTCCNLAFLKD